MVVRGGKEPMCVKSFEQSLLHIEHHRKAAVVASLQTTAANVHPILESVGAGKTSHVE